MRQLLDIQRQILSFSGFTSFYGDCTLNLRKQIIKGEAVQFAYLRIPYYSGPHSYHPKSLSEESFTKFATIYLGFKHLQERVVHLLDDFLNVDA